MAHSEKVLSTLIVLVAQAPPSSKNRFLAFFHKIYCFIVLTLLLVHAVWSDRGKLPILQLEPLSWSLDMLISSLATLINIISVGQGLFMERHKNRLRRLEELFCKTLKVKDEYVRREKTLLFQLTALHVALIIIFLLMYLISRTFWDWKSYQYFFLTHLISTYMIAITLMNFHNFIAFLAVDFGIINKRLSTHFDSFNKQSELLSSRDLPKLDFIKFAQNMHDTLCDRIEGVNRFFGLRILLIVFYTSLAILQHTQLILRLWDSERWNNSLAMITLLPPITLLVLCFMSASACEQAIKEAKSTSPLSFKLLLEHQPMFKDLTPEEKMVRESLLTLASQALQRKPSFTAAGFFNVDYTMLYGMISTVLTYVVIIIQLIF